MNEPYHGAVGVREGREEGPHQQRDSKAQSCPRNLISSRMGAALKCSSMVPLVIICGSHATCTPTWCHGRSGWVRHTPGTGTLLCVIGSVYGFPFSDEV